MDFKENLCQIPMMGNKINGHDGTISFTVEAIAMHDIVEVVIFRNNNIVYKTSPNTVKCSIRWTDRRQLKQARAWYYARVQCGDKELA